MAKAPKPRRIQTLSKAPTGIAGLDAVTQGGLPRGRPTLVSGRAGCGKTVLGLEFVVRGAVEFEEPGLIVSFEESAEELTANVRSLGFDLDDLCARKKLAVEFVSVERHEIEETGDYNLDGLFVRLGHAIDSLGAKRMLLDTIEALFAGLTNLGILLSCCGDPTARKQKRKGLAASTNCRHFSTACGSLMKPIGGSWWGMFRPWTAASFATCWGAPPIITRRSLAVATSDSRA